MKRLSDSRFCLVVAGLLLAAPAWAADAPAVTITGTTVAKKPVKPAAKGAAKPAAAADPQPDAATLITEAHDASGRGETELAERLAQAAIVAAPARTAGYDALGDVYAASRQPEAARSYYSEALSIDPTDAGALKAMAALDHPGQEAEAAEGTKTGIP
jgi:tetratricopeptide (TPR) repeat protein